MPELFDVSDEGIEEFKKDMAEYLKQEEVRNNINKKQVELAELDANNGSYEQATFKKKLDIVFNKAKEVNKMLSEYLILLLETMEIHKKNQAYQE